MKVSFFYTMEDFKTGVKVLNEVVLWRRLMDVALSGILFPLIATYVAIRIAMDGYWQFALFVFFVAVITSLCSFLILPKQIQRSLSKRVEKNKNLIRELSIERFLTILDEEFQLNFLSVNKVIKYNDIEKVIIEDDVIIIMNKSKIDAIIPFRAFETSFDRDLFIEKIKTSSTFS